jgi:hypothetical protein
LEEKEASDLARQVFGIDNSIIAVGIISNSGALLGGPIMKDSYKATYPMDREYWQEAAFKAATMMGGAKATDRFFSHVESLVLIRENSKTLLMWLPNQSVIIVSFSRDQQTPQNSTIRLDNFLD